jgi:hypothetical protein
MLGKYFPLLYTVVFKFVYLDSRLYRNVIVTISQTILILGHSDPSLSTGGYF